VSMPLFGAVSAFGSASVLGVPFLLASIGRDEVVTTAGCRCSQAWEISCCPPRWRQRWRRVWRPRRQTPVLKLCVLPALAVVIAAVLILMWSPALGRLLRG